MRARSVGAVLVAAEVKNRTVPPDVLHVTCIAADEYTEFAALAHDAEPFDVLLLLMDNVFKPSVPSNVLER